VTRSGERPARHGRDHRPETYVRRRAGGERVDEPMRVARADRPRRRPTHEKRPVPAGSSSRHRRRNDRLCPPPHGSRAVWRSATRLASEGLGPPPHVGEVVERQSRCLRPPRVERSPGSLSLDTCKVYEKGRARRRARACSIAAATALVHAGATPGRRLRSPMIQAGGLGWTAVGRAVECLLVGERASVAIRLEHGAAKNAVNRPPSHVRGCSGGKACQTRTRRDGELESDGCPAATGVAARRPLSVPEDAGRRRPPTSTRKCPPPCDLDGRPTRRGAQLGAVCPERG
jgi:hypothetical protein